MTDIDWLARVTWTPAFKAARTLERLGVRHGFLGAGDAPPPARHHARQVHGTRIAAAEPMRTGDAATARVEADGVLTRTRGEIVAVKTADCLPVLLIDRDRTLAIAVHAGWRGLTAGI